MDEYWIRIDDFLFIDKKFFLNDFYYQIKKIKINIKIYLFF